MLEALLKLLELLLFKNVLLLDAATVLLLDSLLLLELLLFSKVELLALLELLISRSATEAVTYIAPDWSTEAPLT